MCASDGGCARFVIRAEGMRAPFAGPVYIRARGRQSDWPMFAHFCADAGSEKATRSVHAIPYASDAGSDR
jgi:hypothetical protein